MSFRAAIMPDSCSRGRRCLRVVNYIHLNPVRAGLTDIAGLPGFRWRVSGTSCGTLAQKAFPAWTGCVNCSCRTGRRTGQAYGRLLTDIAADPVRQKQEGFDAMDRGWAIGDQNWKREVAASFKQEGAAEAPCGPERDAIRAERWQ